MFRNQYDSDVTVWSPQGRIHQVEYAMEAVKQGSATIGLKSNNAVVLVALKRAQNEFCSYQPKIFEIDERIGVSVAGLMADARLLTRFLQGEALDYRELHGETISVAKLRVPLETSKSQLSRNVIELQANTQGYGKRPFGIGMLLAGYDDSGPYLLQTCPSANTYDCKAMAIGARSQSAKTYLENHLGEFAACDTNSLVKHALRALRDTLPNDMKLNQRNTSVGVVVVGENFKIFDDAKVNNYLMELQAESPAVET